MTDQQAIRIDIAPAGSFSLDSGRFPLEITLRNETPHPVRFDSAALVGLSLSGDDHPFMVSSRFEPVPSVTTTIPSGDAYTFEQDIYALVGRRDELVPGQYTLQLRFEVGGTVSASNQLSLMIES